MEHSRGNGQKFTPVAMQSTHWYSLGGRAGFTANPRLAPQSEVARVGLHDCSVLGCVHAGNKADYEKDEK